MKDKFIEIIKKKWLINGTKTTILVVALIAIFMALNLGMQKLNLTPLDFTQEKLYTLTDESKEKVKNIDKIINIYFVGYTDTDSNLDLAKQYNKANSNINVEVIDANERTDIASKYDVTNDSKAIIVENGEKSKTLYSLSFI